MRKRGTLFLSTNVIVVLIIAIIAIFLLIGFIGGSFGKSSKNIAEQLETENEPVIPTADDPITLSREHIKTNAGSTEVIKIAVLNPTDEDWVARDDLYTGFSGCGASDKICYVFDTCDGTNDPDCQGGVNRECKQDGVCLLDENSCPDGAEEEIEDCGPQDGIDVLVKCDNELKINKVSLPKLIMAGETQSFISILDIKKGVKGNYLCEIVVFGNNPDGSLIEGFQKDLTIEVE